jgi:TATA-binding protein-associated factor Taf7
VSIVVREFSRQVGETSPTGNSVREEKGHVIGVEIDGVFVPIRSISEGDLDAARQRQEAEQASGGDEQQDAEPAQDDDDGDDEEPPNEEQSASKSSSSRKPK